MTTPILDRHRSCWRCEEPNMHQTGSDECSTCTRGTTAIWQCGRCGDTNHYRYRLEQLEQRS